MPKIGFVLRIIASGGRSRSNLGLMLSRPAHAIFSTDWSLMRQRGALAGLLFAWLCVNSPQSAIVAVTGWLQGFSHFSHQSTLAENVIEIVTARKLPTAVSRVGTARSKSEPGKAAVEIVAAKKIVAAFQSGAEVVGSGVGMEIWFACDDRTPGRIRPKPPHGPPRSVVV